MNSYLLGVQSIVLIGGTILLAAHGEDLGGVWMYGPLFAQFAARQALNLPLDLDPQGMILFSYPEKYPINRPRIPLAAVVKYL